MLDEPHAALIVAEVRRALEAGLAPGFAQKVAANALGIAEREIAAGAGERERSQLAALLGQDGSLADLATALCAQIRAGERLFDDSALQDALVRVTLDKIAVDQPTYPPYRAWLEQGR